MLPSKQCCYEHPRDFFIVQVPPSVHLCSKQWCHWPQPYRSPMPQKPCAWQGHA